MTNNQFLFNVLASDLLNSVNLDIEENEIIFQLTYDDQNQNLHELTENNVELQNDEFEMKMTSDFYRWLRIIEKDSVPRTSNAIESYLELAKSWLTALDNIEKDSKIIIKNLNEINDKHENVSLKTNFLYEACNHISDSHHDMTIQSKKIEENLKYFTCIDLLETKLFNQKLSYNSSFADIFSEIDSCLTFYNQHPNFKDVSFYCNKAKSCLSKYLSAVKSEFFTQLEITFRDLNNCINTLSNDNYFMVLFGKFHLTGSKLRPLIEILETRISIDKNYELVLNQCIEFFISSREQALLPVLRSSIIELVTKYNKDNCALLRTISSFILRFCDDETKLFLHLFHSSNLNMLNVLLQKVCEIGYEELLPIFLHVNHMEVLAELCDIINLELSNTQLIYKEASYRSFNTYLKDLLADIRERLVFRADVYMRDQILNYVPSKGDIAYPEQLEMMQSIAAKQKEKTTEEVFSPARKLSYQNDINFQPGPNMSLAHSDLHGFWYPTLRRTLICLSKLHRCLDIEAFKTLAPDCVEKCVNSLMKARDLIQAEKTVWDANLFFIKNLIIFREQISPFTIDLATKETNLDVSKLKSVAHDILATKGTNLVKFDSSNAIVRLLLEPISTVEIKKDGRHLLDSALKLSCEKFISDATFLLSGKIPTLLELLISCEDLTIAKPTPTSKEVKDLVSESYRLINPNTNENYSGLTTVTNLASLLAKMNLYLANADTVNVIIRQIEVILCQYWQRLATVLQKKYNKEELLLIGCPTVAQIAIMLPEFYNRNFIM